MHRSRKCEINNYTNDGNHMLTERAPYVHSQSDAKFAPRSPDMRQATRRRSRCLSPKEQKSRPTCIRLISPRPAPTPVPIQVPIHPEQRRSKAATHTRIRICGWPFRRRVPYPCAQFQLHFEKTGNDPHESSLARRSTHMCTWLAASYLLRQSSRPWHDREGLAR